MLEKLLQKPEPVRKRIAFVLTGIVGVIVVSIWLVIVRYEMKEAISSENKTNTAEENFRQSLPSLQSTSKMETELEKLKKEQENN